MMPDITWSFQYLKETTGSPICGSKLGIETNNLHKTGPQQLDDTEQFGAKQNDHAWFLWSETFLYYPTNQLRNVIFVISLGLLNFIVSLPLESDL